MRTAIAAICMGMTFVVACSSDRVADNSAPAPTTTTEAVTSTTQRPDRGPVRLARASWDSGLVHASIVLEILRELGFEPEEIAHADGSTGGVGPDRAFLALARGDADLFANAWFPIHDQWLAVEDERVQRSVGDHVIELQPLAAHGGLQGWLISKAWADQEGIGSLDQIASDPSLVAALDMDGNGKGEIYGCPEDWTCDDIIRSYIWLNEWDDVLEQVIEPSSEVPEGPQPGDDANYEGAFEEFLARVERGAPAIAYTWTPTAYHSRAAVGDNTLWLSVSTDAVMQGARDLYHFEPWPQIIRADGTIGFTELPAEQCTQGPDGCQTGWIGNDITILGNRQWLERNPDVVAVLDAIEFDRRELSELAEELEALDLTDWDDKVDASRAIARSWIDTNRDRVQTWLDAR